MSLILKVVDSPKTEKSDYLENVTLFFIQIKTFYINGYNMTKNSLLKK